ncbi:MAG: 4-(cytidine 5'-diphospho)-2-C-methyl-D-erythritol kinase, partial [Bacteroidetes bacterium]
MLLYPHAKINLGLFIKGKRADGYHLLETLMYPLPDLKDELELLPSDEPGIHLLMEGIEIEGDTEQNLVVRAYRALQKQHPQLPGVEVRLKKNIPAGAGLGGGSSDAAFTLRGLNALFHLSLSHEQLAALAAPLGADVPFFVYDTPMLASGTGTELRPFDLHLPYRIELITPPIHSATAAAYKALNISACDPSRDLAQVLHGPVSAWPTSLVND